MTTKQASHARLAVVQISLSSNTKENIEKAFFWVREAARQGAQIILLPELFENLYFCQQQDDYFFSLAHPVENHPFLWRFQDLAKELGVVLPISFFEKAGQCYFNSLAVFDADGSFLGVYRKSHIPDGPCYQEKFYFNPGDTGFRIWQTRFGTLGTGICWDQWFPECARILSLLGADILLYPTAIGSEPVEAHALETRKMWKRAMIGHAVCNAVYLAASNRVSVEKQITFYGSSFIADFMGETLTEADEVQETVLLTDLDYEKARIFRAGMGFFRDRRPELYGLLLKNGPK